MVRSGRGCDEAHLQTLSGWDAWTSAKTDLSARSGAREGEGVRFAGGRSISHAAKAGRHPGRLRRTPRQVTEWLWKRILCCRHGAPLAGKVHPMWFRWAVMRSARKSHEGLRSVAKHGAIFRVWHGGGGGMFSSVGQSAPRRNPCAMAGPHAILAHRSNDGSDNARPIEHESVSRASPSLALFHVGWPSGLS